MVIHRSAAMAGMLVITVVIFGCRWSAGVGASAPASVVSASAAATSSTASLPAATTSPASSPESGDAPPAASLGVEGGDPVTGQLGSYTWAGGGSDSPWLPGAPLKAAPGESLTMTLAGGVGIARWTARRVPAGAEGETGASGLGSGAAGPVTFSAPPAGSWSVEVTVQFAGDLGSASYYWHLDVK